ncbi:LOW QUALITY PROTEIN: Hypothetical protein PHPALM_3088 [Phytophthora palmivora]|uniref:Uncharacterized protein n=1 Tax=Phytophthora palmivora TaxID=4796 RepID=A0A2P4YNA1_9STRA|nr:LOW QUALITY PROTEIN: Hypothetical protein PHPALM_3088 [Phytophthora palmivora]
MPQHKVRLCSSGTGRKKPKHTQSSFVDRHKLKAAKRSIDGRAANAANILSISERRSQGTMTQARLQMAEDSIGLDSLPSS